MISASILVAIGGFWGAIARYSVNRWAARTIPSVFPYGTLLVNALGSFLLGYLIGMRAEQRLVLLLGTGFMGSFTTFSTFKAESVQLARTKQWSVFYLYIAISYISGIVLAFAGYALGRQTSA